MQQDIPHLTGDIETIAELRELYRAAEARAARLRLLSTSGRELLQAEADSIDPILKKSADRLAQFLGSRSANMTRDNATPGFPIILPGCDVAVHSTLLVAGFSSLADIGDPEDREACQTLLDMMGAAIDRAEREGALARLLTALKDRELRLERLVDRVFSAQEDERRRVAYELHDGVAQSATALVRVLERGGDRTNADSEVGGPARAIEIARGLVAELRGVIGGLRPTVLDDLGFIAALHALGDALEQDGYRVSRGVDEDFGRLPSYVETALYRVAQEAISNIRKHAGGPCDVLIEARSGIGYAGPLLRITDHGRGAACDRPESGAVSEGHQIGIAGMTERMTIIGGSLDWRAGTHGGVTVEARLPGEQR